VRLGDAVAEVAGEPAAGAGVAGTVDRIGGRGCAVLEPVEPERGAAGRPGRPTRGSGGLHALREDAADVGIHDDSARAVGGSRKWHNKSARIAYKGSRVCL